jgi:pimeloyl-ACP methyl ester carboxylesterase
VYHRGTGPAVVLLHPATGSSLVWGYQQATFAAAGYRVVGYSRRGFNGSSPVDPANPGSGADALRAVFQGPPRQPAQYRQALA